MRKLIILVGFLLPSFALALPPITTSGNQVLYGGKQGSLAGNSFFWSNNNYGGERYYNRQTVAWLKQDWQTTIVRAAMGVEDSMGFIDDPESNRNRVIALVDAAIAQDLYVIVDWHSHHAEKKAGNEAKAIEFFADMAQRYGDSNNVIFEIYNEPIDSSWQAIKTYAEKVIPVIREHSNNLIIVGTRFYSQEVEEASQSPISGFSNIAYTLHFYAGTHQGDYPGSLRDKARKAMANGIPLFVTEWGSVNADGNGGVDETETLRWMTFLAENNISHLNWAVNDKQEGASVIKPGTSTSGNWPESALTDSGRLVRNIIRGWTSVDLSSPTPPVTPNASNNAAMVPMVDLLLDEQ